MLLIKTNKIVYNLINLFRKRENVKQNKNRKKSTMTKDNL